MKPRLVFPHRGKLPGPVSCPVVIVGNHDQMQGSGGPFSIVVQSSISLVLIVYLGPAAGIRGKNCRRMNKFGLL
jgi:hypothetical protein